MENYERPRKEIRLLAAGTEEPRKVLEQRKDHQNYAPGRELLAEGQEERKSRELKASRDIQ